MKLKFTRSGTNGGWTFTKTEIKQIANLILRAFVQDQDTGRFSIHLLSFPPSSHGCFVCLACCCELDVEGGGWVLGLVGVFRLLRF